MAFLQRAWHEIRSGENIDLYLTVIFAIAVAVLNLLGFTPQSVLGPITLAILGLLSITALGNRHRLEDLPTKLPYSGTPFFIDEFPPALYSSMADAPELWLIGATLSRTIKTHYHLIETKLKQGHSIRVMVIHPAGSGLEMASERSYVRRDLQQEANDILITLGYLCDLKKAAPDSLDIRTIQYPLSFGAFAINPNSRDGSLYIENYPYRMAGESKPKFILTPQHGHWYDQYKQELGYLWSESSAWRCDGQT